MVKRSVFVVFLLLALVPVSHAACMHERLKPGATHCQDGLDLTRHPVGSSWKNSACQKCWCKDNMMRCCDGWPTRVTGGCTITYDYRTCTYELIHTNTNLPCGASGK